jgi:hypothetical protein
MVARRMWSRTDLKPSDIGVAGLYDGFSFIAMQWLEALGFCGACNVGRRHGANFFIEVTRQLRGTAGDRHHSGQVRQERRRAARETHGIRGRLRLSVLGHLATPVLP